MKRAVGKISRRLGIGITDKGQKVLERRLYAPGQHGNQRRGKMSEYGLQLMEKQKLRHIFGMREKAFRNLYKRANRMPGKTADEFLTLLERRLDNVIYRSGLARTRDQAKQIVGHGHIRVNGRKMDIPSYSVRVSDVIEIREKSLNGKFFTALFAEKSPELFQPPSWIEWNGDKKTLKIVAYPSLEEAESRVDMQFVVEFYSR